MRTPNCKCLVRDKPLYRRPCELAKVRHVACMVHRAEAQKISGVTEAQMRGLSLGRTKGTNHREGHVKSEATKEKIAAANRRFWAEHPDELAERGSKMRGENHYKWKGGASKLNTAIRQMTENRKWMDAVKDRDGYKCVRCGSADQLESHHKIELSDLIEQNNIKSCADARSCPALWDLSNGETLCQKCHYAEHGRIYRANNSDNLQLVA